MIQLYEGKQKFANGKEYSSAASFRTTVRKHLPSHCEICGWAESSIDVCHIIPRSEGGKDTPANIAMLCPNHHRLLDLGKLNREDLLEIAASR
jgi:predicted restriction endonuclease